MQGRRKIPNIRSRFNLNFNQHVYHTNNAPQVMTDVLPATPIAQHNTAISNLSGHRNVSTIGYLDPQVQPVVNYHSSDNKIRPMHFVHGENEINHIITSLEIVGLVKPNKFLPVGNGYVLYLGTYCNIQPGYFELKKHDLYSFSLNFTMARRTLNGTYIPEIHPFFTFEFRDMKLVDRVHYLHDTSTDQLSDLQEYSWFSITYKDLYQYYLRSSKKIIREAYYKYKAENKSDLLTTESEYLRPLYEEQKTLKELIWKEEKTIHELRTELAYYKKQESKILNSRAFNKARPFTNIRSTQNIENLRFGEGLILNRLERLEKLREDCELGLRKSEEWLKFFTPAFNFTTRKIFQAKQEYPVLKEVQEQDFKDKYKELETIAVADFVDHVRTFKSPINLP